MPNHTSLNIEHQKLKVSPTPEYVSNAYNEHLVGDSVVIYYFEFSKQENREDAKSICLSIFLFLLHFFFSLFSFFSHCSQLFKLPHFVFTLKFSHGFF